MLALSPPLLLLLSLAASSNAATYVTYNSNHISATYAPGASAGAVETDNVETLEACVAIADARADIIGYVYIPLDQICLTYNASSPPTYPTRMNRMQSSSR